MAYELIRLQALPLKAASGLAQFDLVQLDATANQVKAVGSTNVFPLGVVDATTVQGDGVSVHSHGDVIRAIAAASFAYGQEVAIATYGVASAVQGGSSNVQATVAQLGVAAGASGVTVWSVGRALETGRAGQPFSVLLTPRQISGLV